jgi:outer membrane lipoprotein-sorting protein
VKYLHLCLLLISLPLFLSAQEEIPSWFQEVLSKAQKLEHISGNFIQIKEMPALKQPLRTQGQFDYSKPPNLNWIIQKPIKSHLNLTPRGSWRILENGKKDRVRGFSQSFHKTLLKMFDIDHEKLKRDFELGYQTKKEDFNQLNLIPKSSFTKSALEKIEILFKGHQLSEVILHHRQSGHLTKVQFLHLIESFDES